MVGEMVLILAASAATWWMDGVGPLKTTPVRAELIQAKQDPCTFFTKAELEAAFGYALQPARPDAGIPSCTFNGRNNPSITISIDPKGTTVRDFNDLMEIAAGEEAEKISGIGDAAFVWMSRMYVRVGTRSVTIGAGLDKASPKVREALVTLGKTAAARLRQ